MNLDVYTIVFMTMAASLLEALGLVFLFVVANQYKGVGYYAVGNLLIAVGFVIYVLRYDLPPFFSVVLANTVIVAGSAIAWVGIARFVNQPAPIRRVVGLIVTTFLFLWYFTHVRDDINIRASFLSGIVAALQFAIAYLLLKGNESGYHTSSRFNVAVSLSYGVLLTIRSVVVFTTRPLEGFYDSHPLGDLTFLVVFVYSYLWTVGFTIMVSQRLYQDLEQYATLDFLTRIANRRVMQGSLEAAAESCLKGDMPFALLLLDVDHFKVINDAHGHDMGDMVLKNLAAMLASALRTQDRIGRWGGEEFIVLLPATALGEAVAVAERLRATVETTSTLIPTTSIHHTVSIGVAAFGIHGTSVAAIVTAADHALYQAKSEGRNRVVSA